MSELLTTQFSQLSAPGSTPPVRARGGAHTMAASIMGAAAVSFAGAWEGSNDLLAWSSIAALNASGTASAVAAANSSVDYQYWRLTLSAVSGGTVSATVSTDPDSASTSATSSVSGANPWAVHPNLWAQLSATVMIADSQFPRDLSGNNRTPSRGANLSVAQLNSAPGYFSTLLAGTNGEDTGLHFPPINFDYDGGEILLAGFNIKMSTPAADGQLLANSVSSSANGFRFRARSTGYVDIGLFSTTGAVSSYSGNSTTILLDNTLHHVGLMIDGRNKNRSFWEDCVLTRDGVGALAACDTRESVALNIGDALAVPTAISHTSATTIRGMFIMRWGANDKAPTKADITRLMLNHRANPGRVIAAGDL